MENPRQVDLLIAIIAKTIDFSCHLTNNTEEIWWWIDS